MSEFHSIECLDLLIDSKGKSIIEFIEFQNAYSKIYQVSQKNNKDFIEKYYNYYIEKIPLEIEKNNFFGILRKINIIFAYPIKHKIISNSDDTIKKKYLEKYFVSNCFNFLINVINYDIIGVIFKTFIELEF